jgi:hypothetical protein
LGSDEATKRARDILLSTLQNSNDTWVALKYLKNLAEQDPDFVYEIATEESGRPTGIWWMTARMRKAWIRYGDSIYLDSMKRQEPLLRVCQEQSLLEHNSIPAVDELIIRILFGQSNPCDN